MSMRPNVQYELPPNMPEDVKAKILQTMGDEGLGESKPKAKKKSGDDEAEEEESSDSELPEDWAERFGIKEVQRMCVFSAFSSFFVC